LPLKPVTREFLPLVERETGYPARLVEEPELPTLARVQIARGNVPAQRLRATPVARSEKSCENKRRALVESAFRPNPWVSQPAGGQAP